ncbi:MAG: V-type ATPase subunit, partial [Actinomycetota bacterium]
GAIPSEEAATALLRARSQYRADESGPDLDRVITELFTGVMEDRVGDLEGPAEVLRAEMDARHVENALRRREARLAGESGWQAPPGSPARVWEEVVETDEAGAAAELVEGRRNLPGWRQALRDWVGHGRITTLSDDLRRVVTHAAVSRFVTGDPLGFDIPLAYTFAKEAETRDLHLIARGLVHGLPPAEVEERLETAA